MSKTVTVDWVDFFATPNASPLVSTTKATQSLTRSIATITKATSVTVAVVFAGALLTTQLVDLHILSSSLVPYHLTGKLLEDSLDTMTASIIPLAKPTSGNAGWETLIAKVLWIVDYLMDGVIIFSGISWMFGNRTKAIELLLGAGVGYIIVRHHEDIKNFFALL